MTEHKTADELAKEVAASFEKALDATKEVAEKALGEAEATGKVATATKEKADEALTKMNALGEQVAQMEQRVAEMKEGGDPTPPKSLGQQFVESEKMKTFLDQATPRGRIDMQVKATITSAPGPGAGAAGALVEPDRLPGVIAQPERRLTIRDMITPGSTDSGMIEYVREVGFTNNAAAVAEGAVKPESDIEFEDVTVGVKTIAHTAKASRQILSDAPQLASYIDGKLRFGLAYKEEQQLLNGDGTGQNLLGIIPQATAYAAPIALPGETSIDRIRLAMLQAVLAEYPATATVMNPIDWAWIETLKDGDGRHIIGNPQGSIAPTLWSLPVVETQAIEVDKFLTGAFRMGAQLFDRWLSRVEIATENEDDFKRNRVTMLCEERLALAVYRPESFIYGDFGRVA